MALWQLMEVKTVRCDVRALAFSLLVFLVVLLRGGIVTYEWLSLLATTVLF